MIYGAVPEVSPSRRGLKPDLRMIQKGQEAVPEVSPSAKGTETLKAVGQLLLQFEPALKMHQQKGCRAAMT